MITEKANLLKVLNNVYISKKEPISAVADNSEVRNAKSITVKINNKIKFNLLYDKNRTLQKKLKLSSLGVKQNKIIYINNLIFRYI